MSNILAMVLAGGQSAGLQPLTVERSTPALPFAGRYRVVDFVLSNLVNSGIHSIYLLVQYKSQSLIEHINKGWVLSHIPGHFITVVPPQMREGPGVRWLPRRGRPRSISAATARFLARGSEPGLIAYHSTRTAMPSWAFSSERTMSSSSPTLISFPRPFPS